MALLISASPVKAAPNKRRMTVRPSPKAVMRPSRFSHHFFIDGIAAEVFLPYVHHLSKQRRCLHPSNEGLLNAVLSLI